ncbi:MAG: hypothetical protein JXA46_07425 [Dehalococcoidales bacterium]|nr:hypothetical protein [Dehalococcoidales bacterium]
MPLRANIGDIIEIPTSKGFAYVQCTHQIEEEQIAVIRVLDGFFKNRPIDFNELAYNKHKFITIFPLDLAVKQNIFVVVGHVAVPKEAQKFPLFRAAGGIDRNGNVINWWLWDGIKSWRVDKLSPEQYKLPIKSIPNDTALIEMIEEGWTPETDKMRGICTNIPSETNS